MPSYKEAALTSILQPLPEAAVTESVPTAAAAAAAARAVAVCGAAGRP